MKLCQRPQDLCWQSYSKPMAPDKHLKALTTEVLLNS